MNFFGVGLPEMLVIFTVALLVFGPRKLPEIGRTLAKTLRSLQDASREFETQLNKEARELEKATRTTTTAVTSPKTSTTKADPQPKTESVATANRPTEPVPEPEPTPDPEPMATTPEAENPQTADPA
ncbi:MAG: TatA/E family twin arginine-targeting protein translocase [Thermostichus sp. DG02_5_bins_236]